MFKIFLMVIILAPLPGEINRNAYVQPQPNFSSIEKCKEFVMMNGPYIQSHVDEQYGRPAPIDKIFCVDYGSIEKFMQDLGMYPIGEEPPQKPGVNL